MTERHNFAADVAVFYLSFLIFSSLLRAALQWLDNTRREWPRNEDQHD